jgi:hypothetical protein
MLKDEWKLVSGKGVELIVPEVPPTLVEGFVRGDLNEFQLLRRAFNIEFHLFEETTPYFNSNLARKREVVSKVSCSRSLQLVKRLSGSLLGIYDQTITK